MLQRMALPMPTLLRFALIQRRRFSIVSSILRRTAPPAKTAPPHTTELDAHYYLPASPVGKQAIATLQGCRTSSLHATRCLCPASAVMLVVARLCCCCCHLLCSVTLPEVGPMVLLMDQMQPGHSLLSASLTACDSLLRSGNNVRFRRQTSRGRFPHGRLC